MCFATTSNQDHFVKESQFLGTLLPSHPDILPIERAIREMYNLPETSPDDDPTTEIYLGDEIVLLEDFRKDIENRVRENLSFLPQWQFMNRSIIHHENRNW
jgi:hypothetical protein